MQLRVRTREADAIDAGRRLLAMTDPAITFIGPHGPVTVLDAFGVVFPCAG
jgi:hypothetical protein